MEEFVQKQKEKKKHWWLRDKPFKRVRLSTLERLALVYSAETNKYCAAEFVLWLGEYMEDE